MRNKRSDGMETRQKLLDSAGRVEKFNKKYAARQSK